MADTQGVPEAAYGIAHRDAPQDVAEEIAAQVRRLGYAKVGSGLDADALAALSDAFERVRSGYVELWGEDRLRAANEFHTVRALCTHGEAGFLDLAMRAPLHAVVSRLIDGTYVLTQQNGIINPPGEGYNQGSWHRDLPYQHFTSSTPLAINALFCLDDFTLENGSTFVIPASHKAGPFPSEEYRKSHALQVEAAAGEFILLDCMTFHSGGANRSDRGRRAVNHVFGIPHLQQQIDLPNAMDPTGLSEAARSLLGFGTRGAASVEAYIAARERN